MQEADKYIYILFNYLPTILAVHFLVIIQIH